MTRRIDPRMAERRQSVAREAGRRRLRLLVGGVAVVASIALVVGLTRSPLLDVDRVEVRGAHETTVHAVLQATGLSEQGHPMIAIDRFALAKRVERLPWIDTAVVTRDWPHTVRVVVTERVAIGAVAVKGGVALLDGTGRVLALANRVPTGVVPIASSEKVGSPGAIAPAAIRSALAVLTGMSENLAKQADSIRRLDGNPATFELTITGGVLVKLGEATQIPEKLAAAEAVLATQHAPGTVIDVRVPRSPAVTHSANNTKP